MSQAATSQVASWPALSLAEAHALLTASGSRFEMDEVLVGGVKTRVWKNAPATLRELFLFTPQFDAREFLVHEDERATYEGFCCAALAVTAELQKQGVKKGDRVVIAMRILPEWAAIFFGAALTGAIVTLLNARWTGEEPAFGLVNSGTKIAFVDAERLERIDGRALARIYASWLEGAIPPGVTALESVIGHVEDWMSLPEGRFPEIPLASDDETTILYNSGTTGKPKGALGTHRNMISNILAISFSQARNYLRCGDAMPLIDPFTAPQRATMLSISFFHVTACFAFFLPVLATGGKLVLIRKFDAQAALALIEREKIAAVGGVPAIAWQILEHPARGNYDLSSLDTVFYGGAPSVPELVGRIKRDFPVSLPGNGWGMTGTSAVCTTYSTENYEHHPGSCGLAVPVCDLKIMSEDGAHTLGLGEVGELWACGPNIVRGYWNQSGESAATFVDGWVRTGNLARLDEEGFCFIVDRAKDMLIRGGENIYCIEVENALCTHPAVLDAALVGIAHRTLGEEPGAVVHLHPGARAPEEGLRVFFAGRLSSFKLPVQILFWLKPLPSNANDKIVKSDLKKLFA